MEDYDEVVIKTVRDLFRSYPLVQIKKYMMTKEGEISDKDNELKTLILDKYTSLTRGIDGLEKISSNLNSLENIRTEFTKKIDQIDFDKIELALKSISFDNDFLDNLNEKNTFNYEESSEQIQQFFTEKKYKEIIDQMIALKGYIDNDENNNNEINIEEKYYFYLVELVEGIMNKMIEDNNICDNIEEYKSLFDSIYDKLVKNKYDESMEYLIMSDLYLKILYDKNIKKIIKEYFSFFNSEDKSYFSINILLKILFLKISQILYDVSKISIDLLFDDKIIGRYYNIYQIIMCIKYICDKYLVKDDNNKAINLDKFYSFIKSEIDINVNSLLVIPKNALNKLYLHKTINFWNNLYLKSDENGPKVDDINLLEYLFVDKSTEQISNITSYTLKIYSINNLFNLKMILKNKDVKAENDIFLAISKLNEIQNGKLYKEKFISTIQSKLLTFLSELNNNVNSEKKNKDKENENRIEYMNIIIKIISYEELIKIFQEFNFNDIIQIINELIEKNQENDYTKIKNYIYDTFKLELLFELYINEEQKAKFKENSITESLKQLIELLYDFEMKEKRYKTNIYLNLIDVYKSSLETFLSKNGNKLLNNIVINDIFILNNINMEQNEKEQIANLIEQIKKDFSIDINSMTNDYNNYEGYQQLNEYFTVNEFKNKKPDFIFDFNKYKINGKQVKIEYFPIYVNKMNVFMLNKNKIDYSDRENNSISTCNIFDYRIEENYMSIKQDKDNKSDNISNSKNESNVFGNITGKLFNFINDD